MGTTSRFAWPYPESTDYVADGATAIENLADAIDTSLDGTVLQVVNSTTETPVSNATGTYVDSGLTATITPSSTSSKVLAIISQPFYLPNNCFMYFRVMSGAAQVFVDSDLLYDAGQVQRFFVSYSELLTPATTSAHVVKTQFHSAGSGTIIAQVGAARSTITLMEIAG